MEEASFTAAYALPILQMKDRIAFYGIKTDVTLYNH